jgi:predicted metalloprotease
MRFDQNSQLDTSQVEDTRGSRLPGGRATIGGGIGIVGLLIALLLGVNPFESGNSFPGVDQVQGDNTQIEQQCKTGEDANTKQDCRTVAIVNSVQEFWSDEFSRRGGSYQPATTRLFTEATQTGCGAATSAVGPFYCPADQEVYIDLDFFRELRERFGAPGDFAQAYVIAHEMGHHVQNLLGISDEVTRKQQNAGSEEEANRWSVKLELQADCLAGVWAHSVYARGDLERGDIEEGLTAAQAVGDDRIQEQAGMRVNPETWTHGSAEWRQHWFNQGFESGSSDACDTFADDATNVP